MILAMAMLLFQFPAVTTAASVPQPRADWPAAERTSPRPVEPAENGKLTNSTERTALAAAPDVQPAQPADPIVEPRTTFLSGEVYNPPPPQLLDFEQAPVTHPKAWFLLGMAEHSSATFDAWSTRRALDAGRVEADPLMRPFASSPAIYGAIQVIPIGLDYLARRLERSSGWTRRIWWAPQSLAAATFLFSGSYNTAHTP